MWKTVSNGHKTDPDVREGSECAVKLRKSSNPYWSCTDAASQHEGVSFTLTSAVCEEKEKDSPEMQTAACEAAEKEQLP